MTFVEWKIWFRLLPLSMKWFVVLILLRPIIDLFYFLKNVSPVLSPLYIVGVLTPIVIFISFFSKRFPKKFKSISIDLTFGLWGSLLGINLLIYFLYYFSVGTIAEVIKYVTPLFLFFYLRNFISHKRNLIGLLQAFYYSASIPLFLLIYELLIGPINPEYLTESRGGEARIQGGYADIMNYAIYITGALIFKLYTYLGDFKLKKLTAKRLTATALVLLFCFIGLSAIKQTASWGVFFAIMVIFLFFNLRNRITLGLIVLFLPVILYAGFMTYESRVEPLIRKEFRVLEGEREARFLLNGRVSRWLSVFDEWQEMNVLCKLFGTSFSGSPNLPYFLSGAMHSDYIRMIFLTGIIGLILYLLIYLNLIKRALSLKGRDRFLLLSSIAATLLFSVSTNPLLYAPYLYFVFPIFAYASLPKSVLRKQHV
tara:strand:- start:159 stop:1436 length:1278 start_codon:yes stop_codon:yes gene_type:complete